MIIHAYSLTVTTDLDAAVVDAALREALFNLADVLVPPVVTTATAEPPASVPPVSIALSDPFGVQPTFNIIAGGGSYVATPLEPATITVDQP